MSVARRLFIGFALSCGAAWLAKIAVIAANGGTNTDRGFVSVLWAVGMVSLLAAAAAGTALLLQGRPWWLRVPAGVAAAPLAFVLASVVGSALQAVYPYEDGWFRDELGLLVVGAALIAAALTQLRRTPDVPAAA